MIVLISNNGNK